ncbi:MAG: hypothetical protein GY842_06350, partial [bacterium]|nr:hypothetical protein [bacterium]
LLAALLTLVLVALPAVRAQDPPATAWQGLLAKRPEAADDTSISTLERKILQVLTPEQADAYAGGRDAAKIVLPGGETLTEFIDRTERARADGLVIRPLEPCTLLDTRDVGKLAAGERRTVQVRGPKTDYSSQGGAADGCGVPGLRGGKIKVNAARAVLLAVEVREAEGSGELALWPSHGPPAPRTGLVAYGPESAVAVPSLIVPLCDEESVEPCRDGDLKLRLDGAGAHVVLTVHGVLEPAAALIDAVSQAATVPDKSTTAPYWEKRTDNDHLYYNDGWVGVGTDTPEATFHVEGDEAGAVITQPSMIDGVSRWFEPDYATLFAKRVSTSRGATVAIGNQSGRVHLYGSHSSFRIYGPAEDLWLYFDIDGDLGLGGISPSFQLDVLAHHPARIQQTHSLGLAEDIPYFAPSDPTLAILRGSQTKGATLALGNQQRLFYVYANHERLRFFAPDTTTPIQTMTPDGNVGIGDLVPEEKLEVDGNIKLSGNIVSDGDICIGNCQ